MIKILLARLVQRFPQIRHIKLSSRYKYSTKYFINYLPVFTVRPYT